jgi:hypothetical protein
MPYALCFDFFWQCSIFRNPKSAFEWANFLMDEVKQKQNYPTFSFSKDFRNSKINLLTSAGRS